MEIFTMIYTKFQTDRSKKNEIFNTCEDDTIYNSSISQSFRKKKAKNKQNTHIQSIATLYDTKQIYCLFIKIFIMYGIERI